MTEKSLLGDVQEHEEYLEARDGTQVFMRSWLPQQEIEHVLSPERRMLTMWRKFLCQRNSL